MNSLSMVLDNPRADLHAVSVFVRVVEAKTFRAAAEALGIPKSTVSLRVAQLEERLGERLLERTTRSLRLTDAGHAYYERVAPALAAMHEAERVLENRRAAPSGRLRVSTTLEGGQFFFAAFFAEYMRRHPNVTLDVVLSDKHVDLIADRVDVAIRAGVLADSNLIARKLPFRSTMCCYASPAYLAAQGVPRRPRDLASHACLVMTSQSRPTSWTFAEGRKAVTIEVRPRAAANSFALLATLAAADLGIARMPQYIARTLVPPGSLRPVLQDFLPAESATFHAIYPSARYLSPNVRALLDVLEDPAIQKRLVAPAVEPSIAEASVTASAPPRTPRPSSRRRPAPRSR